MNKAANNSADMAVVVCDIDNCISADDWRLGLIDHEEQDLSRRFHKYHTHSIFDEPHNFDTVLRAVKDARRILGRAGVLLIFATAMPQRYLSLRRWWFGEHMPESLLTHAVPLTICRPNHCFDPSAVLKPRMVQSLIDEGSIKLSNIYAAFDDREDVVAAYREQGLPAQRLFIAEQDVHHGGTH